MYGAPSPLLRLPSAQGALFLPGGVLVHCRTAPGGNALPFNVEASKKRYYRACYFGCLEGKPQICVREGQEPSRPRSNWLKHFVTHWAMDKPPYEGII